MALPTATTIASPTILPPVTTATATAPATTGAATTPASSGASTLTTLAPAAPAESKGCSGAIKSCFSSLWKGICSCLSCIPWIGKYFKAEQTPPNAQVNPAQVIPPAAPTQDEIDTQCAARIRALFTPATAPGTPAAVVTEDVIVVALADFARIQAPHAKMGAFSVIMGSAASTPAVAQRFHAVLPRPLQMDFENHMYMQNGNSPVVRGVNQGPAFGYHMVLNHLGSDVAKRAAANCAAALLADATAAAAAAAAAAAVAAAALPPAPAVTI